MVHYKSRNHVFTATEFQMGGTELCGPKWNQQLGFLGQQQQNVQGQPFFINWTHEIMHVLMCRNWVSFLHTTSSCMVISKKCSSYLLKTQFNHEKRRMKRKGDRYSMHTSLIVATVKRLLPVGLRACFPNDQSLIMLAKNSFTQVGRKCEWYLH